MFVGTDVACLKSEFYAINNRVNVCVAPRMRAEDDSLRIIRFV